MFGGGFKASKLKAQLQLSGSRIKVIRTKKQNQLVHKRRDIAQLLASGQEPRARIRVEDLLREENTVAAYDILELYCELLVTRMPIIETQKACPPDLKEPVASIVWAAPRSADLPELMQARNMFLAKYGKDFVIATDELRPECGVSRMIINRLSVRTPSGEEKLEKLNSIAEEQNVEWDSSLFAKEIQANHMDTFSDIGGYPGDGGGLPPAAPPQHHGAPPSPGPGSWMPEVGAAAAAAVTAHAFGKHLDVDEPPQPPPPFQPTQPTAPGKPTEAFISPDDYDRRWEGPAANAPAPAPQAPYKAAAAIGHMPPPPPAANGPAPSSVGNPINYPNAPTYLDGKVLPKDPYDYAPSVMASAGAGGDVSEFPSVPRPGPGGGGGGDSGVPGGYQPSPQGGDVRRNDPFSHTAAFEKKRADRERQMQEIEEAGNRAKAAAERASKAAALASQPASGPGALPPQERTAGKGAAPGSSGSSEFPTPPQGFVGASAFDDFVAKGSGGGGSGGSGDISLPSPPQDWGKAEPAPAKGQPGPVLPPPPPPPPAHLWDAPAAPAGNAFDDYISQHPLSVKTNAVHDVGLAPVRVFQKGTAALCRAVPQRLLLSSRSLRGAFSRAESQKS